MKRTSEVLESEIRDVKFANKDDRNSFVEAICTRIQKVLDSKRWSEKRERDRVAICQFNSAIEREQAGSNECQIDMPTSKKFVVMAKSRIKAAIFGSETIFTARPARQSDTSEDIHRMVNDFESFSNYICFNDGIFSYSKFVSALATSFLVFSKAVVKVTWEYTYKTYYRNYHIIKKDDGSLERHWGASKSDYEGKIRKDKVKYVDGSLQGKTVRSVLHCDDFVYPESGTDNVDVMPWVCHKFYRTIDQIREKIEQGIYKVDDDFSLNHLGTSSPDYSLRFNINFNNDDDYNSREEDGKIDECADDLVELWEIYTRIKGEEVVLIVEPSSRTCFYFVYNWRESNPRPFFFTQYEPANETIDGNSMMYELEPIHRARSASFQQRIDASSFSNSSLVLIDERMEPGEILKDSNRPQTGIHSAKVPPGRTLKDGVAEIKFGSGFSQLPNLEESLERDGQMLVGLNPYNAGFEQIDRPTFGGQQMLVSEGSIPWLDRIDFFRLCLLDVLHCEIDLYRQHFPLGITYYFDNGTNSVEGQLQWPVEYWKQHVVLDTRATSKTISREIKRQEWLQMANLLPNIFKPLIEMTQMATAGGPESQATSAMLSYFISYVITPFLDSFGMAAPDEFKEQLNESIKEGRLLNEVIQQMQGQMQEIAQTLEASDQENQRLQMELQKANVLADAINRGYKEKTGEDHEAIERLQKSYESSVFSQRM